MDTITFTDQVIYAVASFGSAVLAGLSGGGGGFLMTPLLVFLGLSPAQAVSTGKIGALAIAVSSIGGMRTVKNKSKQLLFVVMALALVIGLLAPFVIVKLDSELYRRIL